MKTDIDAIMQARELDAIIVTGAAQHNPAMYYFTGPAHMTGGDLIKKRGETPVLYFNPMERDEAAAAAERAGLIARNLADYSFNDFLKEENGDYTRALVRRYQAMFEENHLTSGKVALYGRVEAGTAYAIFAGLKELLPNLEFSGEMGESVLLEARLTKDEQEADRIRKMGAITTGVVGRVADYITSQKVRGDMIVKSDGEPLTIGEIKGKINLWLAEGGADNPEGTIFAIGRDAGVPHSTGNPAHPLRLGQTIVFDIYPCEAGGGYYYDFTRTWCLGYALDPVLALYQDVYDVYQKVIDSLKANQPFGEAQKLTCELFEAQGHPTIQTDPKTEAGYVHSVGHGIGLQVHERPVSGRMATDKDRLVPGSVFTIEPGLYYPERGMGVRLEDSLYVRRDGSIEILAEYPLDLVLPMK